MKKLLSFSLLACLVLIYSCQDDNVSEGLKTTAEITTRGIINQSYYSLGCSYDLADEYLGIDATKRVVVDINAFLADYPNTYYWNNTTHGTDNIYTGATAVDFVNDITQKLKRTKAAEGINSSWLSSANISYESELNNKNTYTTKFSYARADLIKRVKRVYITALPEILQNYVYSSFTRDLDLLSPDNFVEEYGTHVLLDITLGGRMQFNYRAAIFEETTATMKKRIVEAGLGAALKKVNITLTGSHTYINNTSYGNKSGDWQIFAEYFGGETSGISKISFNSDTGRPTVDFSPSEWEKTVNESNATIIDVNWDKTYPIYEFIADPVKKTQIKAAVERYLEKDKVTAIPVKPLYRICFNSNVNTFLSSTLSECTYYINNYKYVWDYDFRGDSYIMGYVFESQQPGTVPLYRIHNMKVGNTFFTTSFSEAQYYVNNYGYYFDHTVHSSYIVGYIYSQPSISTLPLFRLHRVKVANTFYTTLADEASYYVNSKGYYLDNGHGTHYIQGYVIPRGVSE